MWSYTLFLVPLMEASPNNVMASDNIGLSGKRLLYLTACSCRGLSLIDLGDRCILYGKRAAV